MIQAPATDKKLLKCNFMNFSDLFIGLTSTLKAYIDMLIIIKRMRAHLRHNYDIQVCSVLKTC